MVNLRSQVRKPIIEDDSSDDNVQQQQISSKIDSSKTSSAKGVNATATVAKKKQSLLQLTKIEDVEVEEESNLNSDFSANVQDEDDEDEDVELPSKRKTRGNSSKVVNKSKIKQEESDDRDALNGETAIKGKKDVNSKRKAAETTNENKHEKKPAKKQCKAEEEEDVAQKQQQGASTKIHPFFMKKGQQPQQQQQSQTKKTAANLSAVKINASSEPIAAEPSMSASSLKPPLEKGKRGFKRCKNEACQQFINIHQKLCPHCLHEHKMAVPTFEQKQLNKKVKLSSTFEILNAVIAAGRANSQLKIKKKDRLPIQQIKKNALYLDEFNFEKSNFTNMFSTESPSLLSLPLLADTTSKRNAELPQQQLKDNNKSAIPLQAKFKTKVRVDFHGTEIEQSLNHFEHWTVTSPSAAAEQKQQLPPPLPKMVASSSSKSAKNQKQQPQQQPPPKTNWRTFMLNIGYPISCVAWSYSNIEEVKDQYLAVSVNLKKCTATSGEKLENFRTLEAFDLLSNHRIGLASSEEGAIMIFKVAYDEQAHDYAEPRLFLNICVPGTALSIKWLPKYVRDISASNLAVLSSDGAIYFFDVAKHAQSAELTVAERIKPTLRISPKKEVILSCFDWLNDEQCKFIVAGDQAGNIYLFELLANATYQVATYYNNAHMAHVTDVRFFQQSLNEDQILFASAGYDGLIKIFDVYGSAFPLFQYESSLKSVRSIEWDMGGKYMVVNRDKQTFSQILLSFFSTPISKKVELNCFAEARQLQKLHNDNVVTDSSSGLFSKFMFSATETGMIFANFTEQNRRIAVKKTKKKSSELEGFKVCLGEFTKKTDESEYTLSLSDFNALLRGRANSNLDDDDDNEDNFNAIDEEQQQFQNPEKQKIEFQSFDTRSTVSSIDTTKAHIASLNISVTEKQGEQQTNMTTLVLDSLLAFANYGGMLQIMKVFS